MAGQGWQYHQQPGFSDDFLKQRAAAVLIVLANVAATALRALAKDTRVLHGNYFAGLTPPGQSYFAGNYRGSAIGQLSSYVVYFGGLQGCPPPMVLTQMSSLAAEIDKQSALLDMFWTSPNYTQAQRIYRLAEVSAAVYVVFLTIHPYADGNGHMSRFIILCLFRIYGFKHRNLPVHPRPVPPTAPLSSLIDGYRNGTRDPLISYLISTL